jgi:ribosome biogenesis GTPase
LQADGLDEIAAAIPSGMTAVFLGSSGVGKSTITNGLLGTGVQATREIREADSKGRHTTTHRELFVLSGGGMVIDTPGLRELQLWGSEDDLGGVFSDIDAVAEQCRFTDCTHTGEPDCAILQTVASGELDAARLTSYMKFRDELRYLSSKLDDVAAHERKVSHKKAQKQFNQAIRNKDKLR